MRLKSNCFLTKCERAKTMIKLCTLISKENNYGYWIVAVKDNPSEKYFALPHHIRAPLEGETTERIYE